MKWLMSILQEYTEWTLVATSLLFIPDQDSRIGKAYECNEVWNDAYEFPF